VRRVPVVSESNGILGMIAQADLVTEMREIKHPFTAGIKAQQGIEF